MAPYVEREWGAKATELMWRVKALADPDGVLAPGVLLSRRPRRPPAQPEDDPARSRRSATTCVECGFCEPVCPSRHLTTDAAPADRGPPRDGAPAGGLAGPAGAAGAVRVRRARDLRRRRLLRARLPARDRHRQAGQGAARRPSTRERAERRAADRRAAGGGSSARPARGLRAGGPLGGLPGAPAGRCGRCSATSSSRTSRARCPARRRPAARARARGRGGRLLAGLRQPHLRPPARRPPTVAAAGGAGRAVGPRRAARLDPDDVAGHCCGVPWSSKGFRSGARADGEPDPRGAVALERGGGAAGRDRRQLLRAGPRHRRWSTSSSEENRERHAKLASSTRSPGPTTGCCPSSRSAAKLGSVAVHPTCSTRHLGLASAARGAGEPRSPTR